MTKEDFEIQFQKEVLPRVIAKTNSQTDRILKEALAPRIKEAFVESYRFNAESSYPFTCSVYIKYKFYEKETLFKINSMRSEIYKEDNKELM